MQPSRRILRAHHVCSEDWHRPEIAQARRLNVLDARRRRPGAASTLTNTVNARSRPSIPASPLGVGELAREIKLHTCGRAGHYDRPSSAVGGEI